MQTFFFSIQKFIRLAALIFISLVLLYAGYPTGKSYAETTGQDLSAEEDTFVLLQNGKKLTKEKGYETADQPTVYLTFDDGPSKLTGRVLDILKDEGIHATFFSVGEQAESHPELIKRIVNEGHTLGNHTYDHTYKELYSDFNVFWSQIQQTEQVFSNIASIRPKLIRAPGGTVSNFDAFYFYYLDQAGYTVYDWDVDSEDSKRVNVSAKEIIRAVENAPLHHEITVLLHDGSGHEQSVKALPTIIQYYKDKGYTFAPLTEKVKPAQFHVGSAARWKRSVSLDAFKQMHAQIEQYTLAKASNPLNAAAFAEQAEQAEKVLEPPNTVPLHLFMSEKDLILGPQEHKLRDGRFEVPLRGLVEGMGGQVAWDETRQTVTAHYGFLDMDYDLRCHCLRVDLLGGNIGTFHYADMRVEGGTLFVPLRNTVEMLENSIDHYELGPEKREVLIGLRGGYFMNYEAIRWNSHYLVHS